MIAPGPTLETARLILRPIALEDLDGFAALIGDPESARFLGGVQPRAVAWRAMSAMAGSWALQGFSMFSVLEKTTGRWVGRVGPWMPEGWPGPEVGWGLLREYWGRGYATEAAAASMDWAFDQLGWTRVIHSIAPDNKPSQEVARRLGSPLLGPGKLPPPYDSSPIELWGQSREEWRARKK
ncbi:GNAT family N-acetyltransferase [Cystobacter fuscus]|uniref:GNAT family N-acetyltransferase n=1 Tax=Cystobacter fuscus TaxID=43 RepID=UPI002B2EDFD3|nr:GNAT family N-acetyltransferase [Cystobacter fuscus]